MIGECLRQALVEGSVFHVYDNRTEFAAGDLPREPISLLLGWDGTQRYISRAIGQDDQQGFDVRVRDRLLGEHFVCQESSRPQGYPPGHAVPVALSWWAGAPGWRGLSGRRSAPPGRGAGRHLSAGKGWLPSLRSCVQPPPLTRMHPPGKGPSWRFS
jgi:hypothetical protein